MGYENHYYMIEQPQVGANEYLKQYRLDLTVPASCEVILEQTELGLGELVVRSYLVKEIHIRPRAAGERMPPIQLG